MIILIALIVLVVTFFLKLAADHVEVKGAYEYPTKYVALCQIVLQDDMEMLPLKDKSIKVVREVKDIRDDYVYVGKERVMARRQAVIVYNYTPSTVISLYPGYEVVPHVKFTSYLDEIVEDKAIMDENESIIICGCPGVGKTTLVRELGGLDFDDHFLDAEYKYVRENHQALYNAFVQGRADVGDMIANSALEKAEEYLASGKHKILAIDSVIPRVKYMFAIKLDNDTIFKQRNKRELGCLYKNHREIMKTIETDRDQLEYVVYEKHKCRIPTLAYYPSIVRECDSHYDKLQLSGCRLMAPKDIAKAINKIIAKGK